MFPCEKDKIKKQVFIFLKTFKNLLLKQCNLDIFQLRGPSSLDPLGYAFDSTGDVFRELTSVNVLVSVLHTALTLMYNCHDEI